MRCRGASAVKLYWKVSTVIIMFNYETNLIMFLEIVWEPFYVLGVQNYYETSDHDYLPAEIAVVKFTLMQGIVKQYHAILKPSNCIFSVVIVAIHQKLKAVV